MKEDRLALEKAVDSGDTDLGTSLLSTIKTTNQVLQSIMFY